MIRILKITLIAVLFLATACKSAKSVASSGALNTAMTSKQIIKQHQKQSARFKTMQSKVRVEYIQGDQSQTHTINLRMEKDKTIWMSATLGVVRAKITPEKVSFYNKLDQTYFDGDFSLISDFLGTELDFDNVQNIILGDALFDLEDKSYAAGVHEESYLLSPKEQNTLFEIFFLLNPSHFKMDSQQLAQPLDYRMLQIDYKNYQEIDKQILPQFIKVIALEGNDETIINMEFKSVTLNNDLRFPFRIPSGFDEIEIK